MTNLEHANLRAAQQHALGLCRKAQAPGAQHVDALKAMVEMAAYIALLETALAAEVKASNQ